MRFQRSSAMLTLTTSLVRRSYWQVTRDRTIAPTPFWNLVIAFDQPHDVFVAAVGHQALRRADARSSCSLLVQHCLVETVVGDLFQEIADQPCRAVLAHRPRGLTQRLQHAVAEWQRFVWQR